MVDNHFILFRKWPGVAALSRGSRGRLLRRLLLAVLAPAACPQRVAPAQAPGEGARKAETPAARLEIMKKAVGRYTVRAAGEPAAQYRLRPEPLLRFTNTVGQSHDGALFVWTGEADRAVAAAQVFERRDGVWVQELSSLSPRPLMAASTAGPDWTPERPGLQFRAIPDAPAPAATAGQRLVQIRALARRFSVEDDFQRRSFQPLRMLATPLLRYGKAGADPVDGVLLGYVLTTDPEAFLVLEARADGPTTRWHYAFAPMTVYELRGMLDGREVWSVPRRQTSESRDVDAPFHVRLFEPED